MVVRDQVRADFIALVDDGPQGACLRLPSKAVWIAQATGEYPRTPCCPVHFPDRRAILLRLDAILGDVAVRADADIEQRAITAGDQAFCPMVINGAAGPRRQNRSLLGYLGCSRCLGVAHDRTGVGDVEIVIDQGHAEWRVQVIEEHSWGFRNAIAIRAAQQCDLIGRLLLAAATGLASDCRKPMIKSLGRLIGSLPGPCDSITSTSPLGSV